MQPVLQLGTSPVRFLSQRAFQASLCVVALAICAWQLWAFYDVRQDDPFITYRYGQNLVQGNGLTFNPGARFLGATSPAHMLLAAVVYGIFDKDLTPTVMAICGCLAWTAQAAAIFALLVPTLGVFGAFLVALVVDLGGAESYNWVPFETNLAMAFALLGLVAGARGRGSLAAALLALGVLFRPELSLLAALYFCDPQLRRSAKFARVAVVFATLVGSWIVFAFAYYGSALPNSAKEKFQRTTLSDYAEHTVRHLSAVVLPFGEGFWLSLLALTLCLFGAFVLARRDRTVLLFATFTLLHIAAFTLVLRPFVEHTWHLYPCALGAVVFAAAGLAWLSCRAGNRVLRMCAAATLCCMIATVAVRSFRASLELADSYWNGERDAVYQDAARFLRENLQQDEEFASVEVGTLSYYSERIAYDLGGLVTVFATDPMARHPVRLLVLDKRYLYTAPPWPPRTIFTHGDFSAYVYEMPRQPIR